MFLPPAAETVAVVMSVRQNSAVMSRISLRKVLGYSCFGLDVKDRSVSPPRRNNCMLDLGTFR